MDMNERLAPNFTMNEFFVAHDRGGTWRTRTWPQENTTIRPRPDNLLIQNLQVLRDMINRPITISSGIRSVEHNATLSGSSANSAHMTGAAADFQVRQFTRNKQLFKAMPINEMCDIVRAAIENGSIQVAFVYSGNTFIHIGTDFEVPRRSKWGVGFI